MRCLSSLKLVFYTHLPANKIHWIEYHLELRSVNQFAHHNVILVGLLSMKTYHNWITENGMNPWTIFSLHLISS